MQERVAEISSPSENSINVVEFYNDRDIIEAGETLKNRQVDILEKGLQKVSVAKNTVGPQKLQEMIDTHEQRKSEKEKLI